jgi:hypothetical protein
LPPLSIACGMQVLLRNRFSAIAICYPGPVTSPSSCGVAHTPIPESQSVRLSGIHSKVSRPGFNAVGDLQRRYAYVANNPISRTDGSGHCWGVASFIRGIPTYNTTCNNLDMALTIVQSDQVTAGERLGAGAYIGAEFGFHALAIVGSVACLSNVALCAVGAKTALGIGTAATEAACADGDCTNEASSISVTSKPVIDFVSNQMNKVSHIMQPKHAWDRLLTLTGDVSKDYQAIQPFIQKAIDKGSVNQIFTTAQGNPVFQYETTINGQVIIVKAVTLANGVIQVTDSWVKTK